MKPREAAPFILLRHRGEEGLVEGTEELELAHMVDMHTHQVLSLATVRVAIGWPYLPHQRI